MHFGRRFKTLQNHSFFQIFAAKEQNKEKIENFADILVKISKILFLRFIKVREKI